MAFHEVRLPARLAFGSTGGVERRTEITTLASGFERRSTPWADGRRRYLIGAGLRSLDDMAALTAFFEARRGQVYGFRWKDWSDFKSCRPSLLVSPFDQRIGVGDGVTRSFQLTKQYLSGDATYSRPVVKPVAGTVHVAIANDPKAQDLEFVVNAASGVITLVDAPDIGAIVTAGYEFDVPVRFDTDRIQTSVSSFNAGEVPNVPIIEVRL